MDEVASRISRHPNGRPFWIITINPEILLEGDRDEAYRKTLLKADLRVVDGFGISLVAFFRGQKISRLAGADLAYALVKETQSQSGRVALIGGGDLKSAHAALERLQKDFPDLVGIAEDGGIVSREGEGDIENEHARKRIADFEPTLLLVGFGHPKQERWIERYLQEFPSVRVIIGVGGTFDFWSGKIPRAPKWMRAIGIEWLYRLIREPKRWKRIFRAVFVFPFVAMRKG